MLNESSSTTEEIEVAKALSKMHMYVCENDSRTKQIPYTFSGDEEAEERRGSNSEKKKDDDDEEKQSF